jgi:outer membrane protein OmpA-like peptidoglycan-associated protein
MPALEPLKYVVYFDFDKAELDTTGKMVLAEACKAAEKMGATVKIAGNADRAGSDEYNQFLSEMRADAVKKLMVADGMDVQMIEASAYGEKNPAVMTDDGVPEAANRRVEILVERQ